MSESESKRSLVAEMALNSGVSPDDADISGTLSIDLDGVYSQTGNLSDGYDVTMSDVTLGVAFAGSLYSEQEDGSTINFTGTLDTEARGMIAGENNIESASLTANGELTLVDNRNEVPVTTAFTGELGLKMAPVRTPGGELLIVTGKQKLEPVELSISGTLSTQKGSDTASTGISGLMRVTNPGETTVDFPDLPERGDLFSYTVSMSKLNDDTVVIDYGDFESQLLAFTGLDSPETRDGGRYPTQIVRRFDEGDPEYMGDDRYSIIAITPEGYESDLYVYPYNEWDTSGPIATDDILLIAKVAIEHGTAIGLSRTFQEASVRVTLYDAALPTVNDTNEIVLPMIVGEVAVKEGWQMVLDDESEDNFREISLALNFDASATGLDDANIRVDALRTGLNDVFGIAHLSYNSPDGNVQRSIDVTLNSAADLTNGNFNYLTVANADAEMIIQADCIADDETTCDDADFTGTITVGEHQVGTLESRDGVPVFRFGNGERYRILTPNFLVEKVTD